MITKLFTNLRFYILASALVLSIFVASYLRIQTASDQVYVIRSEQVFGLLSVLYLYFALITTPLSKIIKNRPWLETFKFCRRATGVASAYFAILHTYLAFFSQSSGFQGFRLLPYRFMISFVIGMAALIILFLLAATSFDWAVKKLSFNRWKHLHRFVYLAGVLILVHVWLIGTHVDKPLVKVVAIIPLAFLFLVEAIRISFILGKKYSMEVSQRRAWAFVLFVAMLGSLALLPLTSRNYHSEHAQHSEVAK